VAWLETGRETGLAVFVLQAAFSTVVVEALNGFDVTLCTKSAFIPSISGPLTGYNNHRLAGKGGEQSVGQ